MTQRDAMASMRRAIERGAGLTARRLRIEALALHDREHGYTVALAMNGWGRLAPKSANAGSRGARRSFGRPASAFDEVLVAYVDEGDALAEERAVRALLQVFRPDVAQESEERAPDVRPLAKCSNGNTQARWCGLEEEDEAPRRAG